MNIEKLDEILAENIAYYKNNIAFELEKQHDQFFENFGFPKYGITSKDYHEQVYFESYLESYTRKMINNILKDIADYESTDEIKWPELEYYGIYNGYTNTECEQDFGFELINVERKIGYRYTAVKFEEIDSLFDKWQVDEIKIVDWTDEDEPFYYGYEDERIHRIYASELFRSLFDEISEEELETLFYCFNTRVAEAVEEVVQMISLTTLPGFTPYYLNKFRIKIISDIQRDVTRLSTFNVHNTKYKSTELNSKKLIEVYHLEEVFLQKRLYRALVGTSEYAKSFLTSEYLYQYFKKNPMFDYTPIVSGYIKSIEQLLYAICTCYRNLKGVQISMGTWTMGHYKHFIEENEGIIRKDFRPAKDIIVACLESYRIESRNHLFHRDHFNSWERVDLIRNNTIFLYITLLGMLDEIMVRDSSKLLCLLNEEYDKLFKIVDRDKSTHYVVMINGKIFSGMRKIPRMDGIMYNWNGQIKNSIKFKKFDYDHYEELEISSNNMPSEIWTSDILGEKEKLIWKNDS